MQRRRIINRGSMGVSLASLLVVLAFWSLDKGNTSPGEIALAHARHPNLAGAGSCEACHAGRSGDMGASCLACHGEIEVQLSARRGLHGLMSGDLAENCPKCHSEHHGNEFRMINRRSFVLAGIADPERFDHAGLDFDLAGVHVSLACEKCHRFANADVVPNGQKRFLGLDQRCTTCHKDVHHGTFGETCASCHGQEQPFPAVARFAHPAVFPLDGAHGRAACRDCHQPGTRRAVDALYAKRVRGQETSIAARSCPQCHASPHDERVLVAAARATNSLPEHVCQPCHRSTDGAFVGARGLMTPELHAAIGFPLSGPHEAVACEACHLGFGEPKGTAEGFRRAYPGRGPEDCAVCHGDPHRGQFENGPFGGRGCPACHAGDSFRPSLFTAREHELTRLPLTRAHQSVRCNTCHKMRLGLPEPSGQPVAVRVFRGTPTECRACHGDPHGGQFEQGPFRGGNCLACHRNDAFRPPTFTAQQHDRTRFPLTGAHAAVGCNNCHVLAEGWSEAGRQRTHMRVFAGTPSECVACHEDIHGGRFDRPGLPAVFGGHTGCARCHGTERFDRLRQPTFDHRLWTGYELPGAHARATCQDCHQSSDVTRPADRAFQAVAGTSCQACHRDPHVGQFGPTNQVDCTRCHVVGDSFADLLFDHRRDSRFPLDADHARLACSACHRSYPVPGWGTAVRYKPLGVTCGDCHDPRGPRGNAGRASR